MNKKIINAWKQIYAILKATGYEEMYEKEIDILVDFIRRNLEKGE